MINKQANILFIPTSIGGYRAGPQEALSQQGYFQQLIYASLARGKYTADGFQQLGQRLAEIARHAYLAKEIDAVEQASQMMLALPIADQIEPVARYYQALCTWRRGDRDGARRSLERVADESPQRYRARALHIIGLTYHEAGELDTALPFYVAAGKAAANCDLLALAESQEMIAVVRSTHGDHKEALADLERLFPLVRAIGKFFPSSYYDLLNNLAVELAEVGRIAEAEAACRITLASPLAAVHPNWRETRDEIAAKHVTATPSVVAVSRLPEPATSTQAEPHSNSKPVTMSSLGSPPSDKGFFQRSRIPIPARTTFALHAISNLDQMLTCIGPRAPPDSF